MRLRNSTLRMDSGENSSTSLMANPFGGPQNGNRGILMASKRD
jgi:hypothetical protein